MLVDGNFVVAMHEDGTDNVYDITINKKGTRVITKGDYNIRMPKDNVSQDTDSGNTSSVKNALNKARNSIAVDSDGNELTQGQERYFADSKIRDEYGRLKVVYHGTKDKFTVFNPVGLGGKNGTWEGFGIYLSDSRDVFETYGSENGITGYLNITKPADSRKKTLKGKDIKELVIALSKNEAQYLFEEEGYSSINDAERDTWISNYVDTYSKSIEKAYDEVSDKIVEFNSSDMDIIRDIMASNGINDYESAYKFYEILTRTTGIDGFVTEWDENISKGYDAAEIYLAFNSNQIKAIDILNPTDNEDIRYSLPLFDDRVALTEDERQQIASDLWQNTRDKNAGIKAINNERIHYINNKLVYTNRSAQNPKVHRVIEFDAQDGNTIPNMQGVWVDYEKNEKFRERNYSDFQQSISRDILLGTSERVDIFINEYGSTNPHAGDVNTGERTIPRGTVTNPSTRPKRRGIPEKGKNLLETDEQIAHSIAVADNIEESTIPAIDTDRYVQSIFNDNGDDYGDRMYAAFNLFWENIYNKVRNGEVDIAYFEKDLGDYGVDTKALHKSPRNDGLQLSCYTTKPDGKIVPEYHENIMSLKDFLMSDATDYGITVKQIPAQTKEERLAYSLGVDADNADFDFSNEITSILMEGEKALKNQTVDEAAIDKIATNIVRTWKSSYDRTKLADNLKKLFAYMQTEGKVNYTDFERLMSEVARPVVVESYVEDATNKANYDEFRKVIKSYRFTLSDEQKKEVAYVSGSANEFRKKNIAYITIVNEGGVNINDVWSEITSTARECGITWLDDVDSDKDQIIVLADAIRTAKDMLPMARMVINEYFSGKVIGKDNKAFVNGASASEYGRPSKRTTDSSKKEAKARVSAELDNLIDAGRNFRVEADGRDGHVHPDAVNGFSYFDATFKIGNEYFDGVINILNNKKGKLFKDLTKIENITEDITNSYGINPKFRFLRDASMDNVSQDTDSGNTSSVKNALNKARNSIAVDSDGNELTQGQETYFADSKVRDEDGRLKVMYHGTNRADFTVFDSAFSDDMKSIFFTSSNVVAKGYSRTKSNVTAGNKLNLSEINDNLYQSYAEEDNGKYTVYSYSDMYGNESVLFSGNYDELIDYIFNEVSSYGPGNYKVYLNITNPLEFDAKGSNWDELTVDETVKMDRYNNILISDGPDVERTYIEWENLDNAYGDTETAEMTPSEIRNMFGEFVYSAWKNGVRDFRQVFLNSKTKEIVPTNTRQLSYLAYKNGNDGVIIRNLYDTGLYATSSEEIESDVAVVFNPNQIKSVDNLNPTDNDDIRYSLPIDNAHVEGNIRYGFKDAIIDNNVYLTQSDMGVIRHEIISASSYSSLTTPFNGVVNSADYIAYYTCYDVDEFNVNYITPIEKGIDYEYIKGRDERFTNLCAEKEQYFGAENDTDSITSETNRTTGNVSRLYSENEDTNRAADNRRSGKNTRQNSKGRTIVPPKNVNLLDGFYDKISHSIAVADNIEESTIPAIDTDRYVQSIFNDNGDDYGDRMYAAFNLFWENIYNKVRNGEVDVAYFEKAFYDFTLRLELF